MSRKLFLALLFLMTSILTVSAQNYLIYGVGFYNLENLFDTEHDQGKNDYEYLPDGRNLSLIHI